MPREIDFYLDEHERGIQHRRCRMWRQVIAISVLLACLGSTSWGIDGTFQGRVVDPPSSHPLIRGWIYVQGPNHTLRRVEVSHAAIVFGESVPVSQRHKCTMECLSAGQEVRVTAEQDRTGEWRAKRIEILKLTQNRI